MRVVLIEDDPTISVPLADGLMRSGFDVVAVATAADGLAAVDGSDLVLLDLGLPDLDGSEVCRRIRQTSSVPIIASAPAATRSIVSCSSNRARTTTS